MARGKRFTIVQSPYDVVPTRVFQTDAAATIIERGMFMKRTSEGSPYVTPSVNGDATIGTDTDIVGLAAKDSSHTSTADGTIEVYAPLPGLVYRGYATTAGNVAATLEGDRITITVSATTSAGDWTINEDAGDSDANAFQIYGVDTDKDTIDFILRLSGTEIGSSTIA